MRPISLITKLILLAVLPAALIAGALGGFMVWRSYQSLRDQAQAAQLALAKSLASQADQGISQAFLAVQLLARAPAVTHLDKFLAEQQLSLVTQTDDLLDAALVVLPSGRIFSQSRPVADSALLPPHSLYRDNLARVRELNESVITDIYPAKRGAVVEPAQAVSAPIFKGKQLVGTLVGIMHLPSDMDATLHNGKFGKDGFAYLVNEEGLALAHTDPSKIFKDFSSNPAVAAALRRPEGIVQYKRTDGVDMLAAFARVESATWSVVLTQPLKDAYEPATHTLMLLLVGLTISVLILAGLAGYMAKRLVDPLALLTDQVKRQDWNALASPRFGAVADEVGLLAQALSRMATDLELEREEREAAHKRALDAERLLSEKERLASIGQLAAGLAHELNNPLTVIQGAAEVAQASRGKNLKQWMLEIRKETSRCKRLVADLLDFSRPLRLKLRSIDLNAVAREAWEQSVLGRVPLSACQLVMKREVLRARVDSERLKQVFLNLFSNAREAGATEVKVSFTVLKSGLRVGIFDNGPGLGKEAEKYFRPFFTTRSGGTGLGLSIARMVVQTHGGRLWAENRPKGRGAHFFFELPLKGTDRGL
jgi:signal transduction histidine kinase